MAPIFDELQPSLDSAERAIQRAGQAAERLKPSRQELAELHFSRLQSHIESWFHAPDWGALRLMMAAATAHRIREEEPVWLFVLGNSGSGKTSIVMNVLGEWPLTNWLDDLTPQTLLSGFQKGRGDKSCSYLHSHIGDSGMVLMSDFSTFTAKRPEDKSAIAGQLRRVYDGHLPIKKGAQTELLEWRGKCTFLCAGTSDVEHQWMLLRQLGERFLQTRWRSGDSIEIAICADKQVGHEDFVKNEMRRLTREFLTHQPLLQPQGRVDVRETGLVYLANMVTKIRAHVPRNGYTHEISDVPSKEEPSRVMKSFTQVARAHASLFRREVNDEDLSLVRRLAWDCIPRNRVEIFRLLKDGGELSLASLMGITKIPRTTLNNLLEDMKALEVVEARDVGESYYRLTEEFSELVRKGRL